MPIRPENRDRYPANWDSELRPAILRRAGLRCECVGECGRGHRSRCVERHGHRSRWGGAQRVVLTVAHLTHEPEVDDTELLKAMCPGCHVHYDRAHHQQSAVENWQRDLEQAGQAQLFEPVHVPLTVTPVDHPAPATVGVVTPVDGVALEDLHSIQGLRPEVREVLLEAIAEHQLVEEALAHARAYLAGAIAAAAADGAHRRELAAACRVTKPTVYRLLSEHAANQGGQP